MSWTSEHDPPASGSGDDGADATSIPDEGPLDPSVFDGLFDDLASDEPDEVVDNPLDEFLAVTLTGEIEEAPASAETRDADGAFSDPAADADLEPVELDDELGDQPADETELDLDPPSDPTAETEADPDHAVWEDPDPDGSGTDATAGDTQVVSVFDSPPSGFGLEIDDQDDVDAEGRPLPPAMPTRTDEPTIVEAEADLDRFEEPAEPVMPLADLEEPDQAEVTERFDLSGPELQQPEPATGGFFFDPELDGPPVDGDGVGIEALSPPDEFDGQFDDLDAEFDDLDGGLDDQIGNEVERLPSSPIPLPDPEPYEVEQFAPEAPVDDGPFRASPPIQHDPPVEFQPQPEPVYETVDPVAEHAPVIQPEAEPKSRRSQRVLVALVAAVVIGGGFGIGGAMLLSRVLDRSDSTPATAAATGAAEDTETAAAAEDGAQAAIAAPATSLRVTSLRFETGAAAPELVTSSAREQLVAAIERDPAAPVVATVRTFTEISAAEDLALSRRQAEALTAELVELGADPAKVAIAGLGRSLLSGAQPVPNFVVPSAGLDRSNLADAVDRVGPFAIGLEPMTGQLRAESVAALDELARAMAADPDGRSLTLAAYSFDQPDRTANERQAQLAIEAATTRLTDLGIDPARLTTIVAGDEPYAVPDPVANHIDLHWGESAATPLALSTLAIDQIDFAPGSAELDAQAGATVDQLATVLIESGADAVIDVHSFDGDAVDARVELSVNRAQTIGQRLLAAGVSAEQLRLHGGTSSQFRDEGRVCRVVVSVLQPPDQS